MRVIAVKTLRIFWEKHRRAKKPLSAWYYEAKRATWKSFSDIKASYPSADVIPGNRVVFDIHGNTYRLIVHIHYNTGIVYIRFIGTHAEYDAIDAATV